jgi:hypothetical protein
MGKLLKWLEPVDVHDRGSASCILRTHSLFTGKSMQQDQR